MFSNNLSQLDRLSEKHEHAEIKLLTEWCQKNLRKAIEKKSKLFNKFINSGECWEWVEALNQALANQDDISYLTTLSSELLREEWLIPFPEDDLSTLILSFQKNRLGISDEQSSEDSIKNETQDTSHHLRWDEDIHPELLSVYFQETPDQVSELAVLLQKIAKNSATKEEYKTAARIAHTIKGASGVVGIDAIVDFTHKLEDILDFSVSHDLPQNISELLAEASDCLEDLFEAIINKSEEPAEFSSLLKALTVYADSLEESDCDIEDDSLFVLETPDLPDFITTNKSTPTQKEKSHISNDTVVNTPPVSTQAQQSKSDSSAQILPDTESHIKVPINIIDNLLNLAGELVTTSSQVSDQIDLSLETVKDQKNQDQRIHKMLDELSVTISKQEKTQAQMLENMKDSELDTLEMDTYNELHSITGLLTESILDGEEFDSTIEGQFITLNNHARSLQQINKELSDVILSSRMISIETLVPRLERIVRQTCRKTNKEAELIISGNDINIDTDILNGLVDPLLHLLRNAVDHGIEAPEIRQSKQKDLKGKIHLSFSKQGNYIQLLLEDDGHGIDVEKIRQSALKKQMISESDNLSKQQLLNLILHAGFSTHDNVTDISGRGVGMDVVNNAVKELKGTLTIDSDIGAGTRFNIKIPLTLVTSATLLVRTSTHYIAIPSDSIEQLYYLSPDKVINRNNIHYVKHAGKELVIQSLASLLDWPETEVDYSKANTLLLIKGSTETHAIYIDEIIHSREVVVKSLDFWLDSSKGLVGACHLPDGGVAPVINLQQLLSLNEDTNIIIKRLQENKLTEKHIVERVSNILVVDDSLSNRKALSLIIEPTDYNVITAVDGMDALHIINEQDIDMVFTDLEMPRMNGLELTQAIRAWDGKKDVPIVMITSRTTKKHRLLARKAGVDDYLTKPVIAETLLASLTHWLETNTTKKVTN